MRQAGLDPEEDADRVAKSSYLPSKPGFNAVYVKYLDIEKPGGFRNDHLAQEFLLPPKLRFTTPTDD